jgi:hypothetical protein
VPYDATIFLIGIMTSSAFRESPRVGGHNVFCDAGNPDARGRGGDKEKRESNLSDKPTDLAR